MNFYLKKYFLGKKKAKKRRVYLKFLKNLRFFALCSNFRNFRIYLKESTTSTKNIYYTSDEEQEEPDYDA